MHIDTLEPRQLLTATAAVVDGTLLVRGTTGRDVVFMDDRISYRKSANRIVQNDLLVTLNGLQYLFDKTTFNSIDVRLGRGDDRFEMGLRTRAFHTLALQDGKLVSRASNYVVVAMAEAGNDTLAGNGGNETLNGGSGHDLLSDGYGDDLLQGGDGNDMLEDTLGRDTLEGNAGNDVINLGEPATSVFGVPINENAIHGGAGTDRIHAWTGLRDRVFSVEVRRSGDPLPSEGYFSPDSGWY